MKSQPESLWTQSCTLVTGPSHRLDATDCQDFYGTRTLGSRGEVLLLAISDGAGSAALAREGAEIVVQQWLEHFDAQLSGDGSPADRIRSLTREDALSVLEAVRDVAFRRAADRQVSPSEFSATLLGAVIGPECAFFAQVGDGSWVGHIGKVLGCITWPTHGEFASQTVFALSRSAPGALQCVHIDRPVTAVAGFTDGVERISLHLAQRIPEPRFFLPLFDWVRREGPRAAEHIGAYLESESVRALSDDDKTLLCVVRHENDL
jgi:hypothetical protein